MAESFLARLTRIEQHHPRTPALKMHCGVRASRSAPIRTRRSNSKGIRSSVMNVETGAEQLGKTQVGFAPTSHASYLLAKSWLLADFITLMKPRVMALPVFTAMVGIIAAPRRIHPPRSI